MEDMDSPPDGGWGWMVVLGAALINMVNQALFSIFGLIFGEQLKDMAGGKATGITLVMAVNVMVTNFSGLGVAAMLKKMSIRTVTLIGITCVAVGMILSSFATEIIHVVFAYGCLTGLGLGILASSTFLVITKYFTSRKSTAVGIAMSGTSIGQMIMPIFVGVLLNNYEYSGTTKILGCLSFTGIVGALFFKPFLCFKSSNETHKNVETAEHINEKQHADTINFNINNEIKMNYQDECEKTESITVTSQHEEKELLNKNQDDVKNNNAARPSSTNTDDSATESLSQLENNTDDQGRELSEEITKLNAENTNANANCPSIYISNAEEENIHSSSESNDDVDIEIRYINSERCIRRPSTNPFGSDSDLSDTESSRKVNVVKLRSEGNIEPYQRPPSTNPFGSDSDLSDTESLRKSSLDYQLRPRPPSTNPFESESDTSDAESVGNNANLQLEKSKILNDIINLTKSVDNFDTGTEKVSTNPFGSEIDLLSTKTGIISKKFSSNPFGSVDELQEDKMLKPKKRFRLFADQNENIHNHNDNHENNTKDENTCEENIKLLENEDPGNGITIQPNLQSVKPETPTEKPPGRLEKLSQSLGLRLLKDIQFLHLLLGLAFGYVSTVTFSTFFPMFLQDEAKLGIMETTTCMSALSFADIAGRLTVSEISRKLNLSSRGLFIIGALCLGICRSIMVQLVEYKYILIASFFIGYCRSATVITQNLVVSEYIGSADLPAAVGLNMVTKGIFVLTIGQSLGVLKDMLSYRWCIHFLDIILYIVAICWSIEIAYKKKSHRKLCNYIRNI